MNNLLLATLSLFLLFQVALAQTPGDSTDYFQVSEYPAFQENYNAHAAFVNDNRWTTSIGTRSLGRRWKNVADEFKISPEGEAAFQQALKQRGLQPIYIIAGLGLTLGSIPLVATSTQFDFQAGLGLGMLAGGVALTVIGGKKARQSENNFERALWLRNRDEMLQYTSPASLSRFRYLYETETLYLTTNSYVKNGREQKLGFLGDRAAGEFRDIPTAWNMYRKYRNNQRFGAAIYAAGLVAMVVAPNALSSRSSRGQWLYYGGLIGSSAGLGIALSGRRFLREAVHIRNYTVLNQKMLPEY